MSKKPTPAFPPKRILVTGGAGYLGSILVKDLLRNAFYVRVLDNLSKGESLLTIITAKDRDRFELLKGDIRDSGIVSKVIEDIDVVIHLAAIVGDSACKRQPRLARETNWMATKRLIDMSMKFGVKEFIFASTCSNYGIQDTESYATEDTFVNPLSLYAQTKVDCEKYLLGSTSVNFCTTVLRLATTFGVSPRMRFDLLVNNFTKEAVTKRKIVIYNGQSWRPYIHVQDVSVSIQAVIKASRDIKRGKIYNVGSTDQNYKRFQVGELVKQIIPGTTIEYIDKNGDPKNYRVAFERIKNELGILPKKSMEYGIKEIKDILEKGIIVDYDDKKYIN